MGAKRKRQATTPRRERSQSKKQKDQSGAGPKLSQSSDDNMFQIVRSFISSNSPAMLKNSLKLLVNKTDQKEETKKALRPTLDDMPIASSSLHIMKDKMAMQEYSEIELRKKRHDLLLVLNCGKKQKEPGDRVDIRRLRELCLTKHGLVNNEIRMKAWPLLLNLDVLEAEETAKNPKGLRFCELWKKHAATPEWCKEDEGKLKKQKAIEDQVDKDVNRSLNTFDVCKKFDQWMKVKKRDQLRQMIMSILNQNQELHYFQGFHDIVSVFLLTLEENVAFYCAKVAANYLIKDFMLETFDMGVFPALDMTSKLIELVDDDLHALVESSGGQPNFALSWILTWFSHDIDSFEKVQLIFDACLATHPSFASYVTVAQLMLSKTALLGQDPTMDPDEMEGMPPEIIAFMVFKDIRENQKFQVDEAIQLAARLYNQFPPHHILKLVQQDQQSGTPDRKIHTFSQDSPVMRYQMEKLYLTNSKLTVETPTGTPGQKEAEAERGSRLVRYGVTALFVISTAAYTWSLLRPKMHHDI